MRQLYTIGYEGSSIEDFLATLKEAKIELLIDVREVPISRKRGFSKSALSAGLAAQSIDYLHLKGLGDPKPGRLAAREGRYDEFRKIFSAHLRSETAQIDLRRGIDAAKRTRACLLCFEKDHKHCHRCIVADEMAKQNEFQIIHACVSSHKKKSLFGGSKELNGRIFAHIG